MDNINQVIDKLIPLGAVRAEVMYYGMPFWWHNDLNTSWASILIASSYLSGRYNVDLQSLLGPDKVAKKLDPDQSLDMALLDNARSLICSVSRIRGRYVFFRPTQSIIGLSNRKIIASSVPLDPGADYNSSLVYQIDWSELSTEDAVFLERVLNIV